jgi:hypothetical protein
MLVFGFDGWFDLMVCWGVNLPVAQHMSRVDCVVVIQ